MSDLSPQSQEHPAELAHSGTSGLVARFLSNATIAVVASVVARAIGFLLFALVARSVEAGQADAYALAMNYLTLFLPISSLGLSDPIARDVSQDRALVVTCLINFGWLRLVSAVVCYGILALVAVVLFDYPKSTADLVLLMGLSLVPEGLSLLLRSIFTALERQVYNAVVMVAVSVCNLGLVYWVLQAQSQLVLLGAARLGSALLGLILGTVLMIGVLPAMSWRRLGCGPDWLWIKSNMRTSWPFMFMVILYTIEWRADLVILSATATEGQVAHYYTAQLCLLSFLLLLDAFRLAALPPLSRLYRRDPKRMGFVHDRFFWYLAVLAVPIALGASILAPDLLSIFGSEYAGASNTLAVLMVALVVSFLNEPNGLLMIAAGQQKALAALFGVSLTVNIVANLILAPLLGGLGLAIARVLSVSAYSIPNAILVSKRIRRHHPLSKMPRVLLAGGCMSIVLAALRSLLPWWLAGLLAGGVYFVALLVLKGLPIQDLAVLRQYGVLPRSQRPL